jgi:hypothetical protein
MGPQNQAGVRGANPILIQAIEHLPTVTKAAPPPQNPQMWKICQEASRKSKVMSPHSKRLPNQNLQTNLASFQTQTAILNLEWKKEKSLANRRGFSRGPGADLSFFSLVGMGHLRGLPGWQAPPFFQNKCHPDRSAATTLSSGAPN